MPKLDRFTVFQLVGILTLVSLIGLFWTFWFVIPLIVFGALTAIGVYDVRQTSHSILRNYPVIGHMRFLFEGIRPEIRQYLIESDQDEEPFSREARSLAYQRAKGVEDKRPFGTKQRVYDAGYQWITHSMAPKHLNDHDFRVKIGGPDCKQPYEASLYNISAMSFGALSANAALALNKGAKLGGFAHNTGEGGISRYHLEGGADIIFQLGSGYFGCLDENGKFSPERFAERSANPQVKMIEIKLSQGAKPGHGGVLPASKISPEIAEARDVPLGVDCVSPACHPKFSTPLELMAFITELRELSKGKPVGFKLCVGHRREFLCMVKAMVETGVTPDFIVVDGSEGGTGAAPLEFSNHVGMPLVEGLTFVHNALIGAGLRDRVKIGASGKVISAFDIAKAIALGADYTNSARGFMFSLGCIQAQACHTNRCPVGVTTQDQSLMRGLDPTNKAVRVAAFHNNTMKALAEMAGCAGLDHPKHFLPRHLMVREKNREMVAGEDAYPTLPNRSLIDGVEDKMGYLSRWNRARSESFAPVD